VGIKQQNFMNCNRDQDSYKVGDASSLADQPIDLLRTFELSRPYESLHPISRHRRLPAWLPSRSLFFPAADRRTQWT